MKKIITMEARLWFDHINGNTYHSVKVFVNNKFLDETKFAYGYNEAYKLTGFELLQKHGIYTEHNIYHDMIRDCMDNRDNFLFSSINVQNESDL